MRSFGTIVITFNVYAIFWGDKKPARSRVLLALPSRIKTAKYQIYTKYMRFNLLLQILCYENAAFCFERVLSTNNKASLSSR